jgi:hypothetical protein
VRRPDVNIEAPTVHLNGTSKDSLIEPLDASYFLLDEAVKMMKQSAPNGRDYYVKEVDSLSRAMDQHLSRMKRVDDVMKEIEELIGMIHDQ